MILWAARQESGPLEKPQGRRAGPALPGRTPLSPFAGGAYAGGADIGLYVCASRHAPPPGDTRKAEGHFKWQRAKFEGAEVLLRKKRASRAGLLVAQRGRAATKQDQKQSAT